MSERDKKLKAIVKEFRDKALAVDPNFFEIDLRIYRETEEFSMIVRELKTVDFANFYFGEGERNIEWDVTNGKSEDK